jgi:hypothetical protein
MRASWIMLVAAGPLALWGGWVASAAVRDAQWLAAAIGAVGLVTAGGLMLLKPWARTLAYVFATGLVASWFYAVAQVISRGWPYADWLRTVVSLIPGAAFLMVCGGGAWVVHRQYRHRTFET